MKDVQQQQQEEGRSNNFSEEGGAKKEKNDSRVAERGREWNEKVKGEVGNEVYLIWVNLKLKWGKGNH